MALYLHLTSAYRVAMSNDSNHLLVILKSLTQALHGAKWSLQNWKFPLAFGVTSKLEVPSGTFE